MASGSAEVQGIKRIVVTAVLTFVVTAAAGIVTYWLTIGLERGPSAPSVVFSDLREDSVDVSDGPLAFVTFTLENTGSAGAESVVVLVHGSEGAEFIDHKVDASAFPSLAVDTSVAESADSLRISLPNLVGGESVSISAIARKQVGPFQVSGRTSDAVIEIVEDGQGDDEQIPAAVLAVLLVTALVGAAGTTFVAKLARAQGSRYERSMNNAAFALMHSGDWVAAKRMLISALVNEGASGYEFCNIAGCCAAEGDITSAKKYMEAATFFFHEDQADAVLNLNKAIIAFGEGNATEGHRLLDLAIKQRKAVGNWVKKSALLKRLAEPLQAAADDRD